jgi:hypothetical protein
MRLLRGLRRDTRARDARVAEDARRNVRRRARHFAACSVRERGRRRRATPASRDTDRRSARCGTARADANSRGRARSRGGCPATFKEIAREHTREQPRIGFHVASVHSMPVLSAMTCAPSGAAPISSNGTSSVMPRSVLGSRRMNPFSSRFPRCSATVASERQPNASAISRTLARSRRARSRRRGTGARSAWTRVSGRCSAPSTCPHAAQRFGWTALASVIPRRPPWFLRGLLLRRRMLLETLRGARRNAWTSTPSALRLSATVSISRVELRELASSISSCPSSAPSPSAWDPPRSSIA